MAEDWREQWDSLMAAVITAPGANDMPGLARFLVRITTRLEAGDREYGGSARAKTPARLAEEACEELEDVVGWDFWANATPRDVLEVFRLWQKYAERAGL